MAADKNREHSAVNRTHVLGHMFFGSRVVEVAKGKSKSKRR